MSEHKDYGGECYTCGGDWPCDYERGYRDALTQAADAARIRADDFQGVASVEKWMTFARWLLVRARAEAGEPGEDLAREIANYGNTGSIPIDMRAESSADTPTFLHNVDPDGDWNSAEDSADD